MIKATTPATSAPPAPQPMGSLARPAGPARTTARPLPSRQLAGYPAHPAAQPAGEEQRHRGRVRVWLKRTRHRALISLWRRLPDRMRRLALRVGMASVSVGACALVRDAQGRLLLAHHTYHPRAWGLPGGFIGNDEQPGDGLARELREELCVEAVIGPLVYAETWLPGQHLTLYYTATLRGMPVADGIELDGFRFVTLKEARALLGREAEPWLAALTERRAS